ncbi:hypothetical protein SISNIDRAFT_441262 [Sistotremastrum niveocremeum HHB9708]|uniref:RFX-type winged-helix domain-containing protein n=1 Tax=Sistotremastrum niveocremeum HHB9708 TaxID=1314777 RepID=A0A164UNY4_9AGAM|nr:hypothetical protein SISNIDRAFT_441262 [Sistotremastrum niveocremeum HHB9708]
MATAAAPPNASTRPAATGGAYYRTNATHPSGTSSSRPQITTDDYEPWYTQPSPSNRMLLSLKSEIPKEVEWALDRLCRLSRNEQFFVRAIPGLIDALCQWPEWYVNERAQGRKLDSIVFCSSPEDVQLRRHALESLFVLRNASFNDANAVELATHRRTQNLLGRALTFLDDQSDIDAEFLVNCIELLHSCAPTLVLPPASASPTRPIHLARLENLTLHSTNRSLIIPSLLTLTLLLHNPKNAGHFSATSPALTAGLRYLPLFVDTPLTTACLEFLYAHLSNSSMCQAFLLHPELRNTVRLLLTLIISEQAVEETSVEISATVDIESVPSVEQKNYELVGEELDTIVAMPEPERSLKWLKTIFATHPTGELTQVEFWNLYKDTFTKYAADHPMLAAADVIKNVTVVFPHAQAMVIQGPPQKFVIRGIDRRKVATSEERFKCLWDRSSCSAAPLSTARELWSHLTDHLALSTSEACLWGQCPYTNSATAELTRHLMTHIAPTTQPPKYPGQPEIPTPSTGAVSDTAPTTRVPPPPPNPSIKYITPTADAPNRTLIALLIIRILFRASFASVDAAPRADGDHFGFPGVLEEMEEEQPDMSTDIQSMEGELCGRRVFVSVRDLLNSVKLRDASLMNWINEMADVGLQHPTEMEDDED